MTMLVSFATGTYNQNLLSLKQELLLGGTTFILVSMSVVFNKDSLYVGFMLLYIVALIFTRCTVQRIQKILLTLFLALLTYFPLNTITMLLNILKSYNVLEHDSAVSIMGALADCLIIFGVYHYRKSQDDRTAIHFTLTEYVLSVFIFLFTAILGTELNPATGIISNTIIESTTGKILASIIALTLTFVNLLFLVMIWRSKTSEYYKQLNKLNQQYIEQELEYFETYKQAQEEIRIFRHDMKHHISRIAQLCTNSDLTALKNYVGELHDNWEETLGAVYQTGDSNVDAILNAKVQQMHRNHISFSLSGAFVNSLSLSSFDLCAIFSNAIDNAIEENLKIMPESSRFISLSIRRNNFYYIISLENPMSETSTFAAPTTKTDSHNHGFGLRSIREKVAKHGGTITVKDNGQHFILDIFLPI
ncbi:sensor histidine kinase [[Clostridium] symbiosum]|uniref:sensor histidine kinase n=1 Tax=Clostridium symbiosum TaxID=1512 RepID=UPI00214BADF7|nr:sensor histidine kinase [[Clostridium] symbiosum]MCR1942117.1 GHKL domain-containing protein [[Clostridium] symbiosum]